MDDSPPDKWHPFINNKGEACWKNAKTKEVVYDPEPPGQTFLRDIVNGEFSTDIPDELEKGQFYIGASDDRIVATDDSEYVDHVFGSFKSVWNLASNRYNVPPFDYPVEVVDEDEEDEVEDEDDKFDARKQSYNDYPEAAKENAQMALDARDETDNPNDCGTRTGWERANQLASGESISRETIARMSAFERHRDNKDRGEDGDADCGWMMWKAWGGDEGIEWAQRKLEELDKIDTRTIGEKMGNVYEFKNPRSFQKEPTERIDNHPDIPDVDTAPEAKEFVDRLAREGYDGSTADDALLYELLGTGTMPWKMSKEDADYVEEPVGGAYCGNCKYAWYSNQTGKLVCSKMRGYIEYDAWCRLWDYADPDPHLEEKFGVPDSVE